MKTIRYLDLCSNILSECLDVEFTSDGLNALSSLKGLEHLRLEKIRHYKKTRDIIEAVSCVALTRLDLIWCETDDELVSSICKIITLQQLEIRYSHRKITWNAISQISTLNNLHSLKINRACAFVFITYESLKALTSINLTVLHLTSSRLVDECLLEISTMSTLREFNIYQNYKLTFAAFSHISHLQNLQYLNISTSGIDDRCIKYVSQIRSLKVLDISYNGKITNATFAYLLSLPNLEDLNISCRDIGDECINIICKKSSFKKINLSKNDKISPECLKNLSVMADLNHFIVLNYQYE